MLKVIHYILLPSHLEQKITWHQHLWVTLPDFFHLLGKNTSYRRLCGSLPRSLWVFSLEHERAAHTIFTEEKVWPRHACVRACVGGNLSVAAASVLESASVSLHAVGEGQQTGKNKSISGKPQLSAAETWTGGYLGVLAAYASMRRDPQQLGLAR